MQVFSERTDKPHAYLFGEYTNPLSFDPIELSLSEDGQAWQSIFDDASLNNVYLTDFDWLSPVIADTYRTAGTRDGQQLANSRLDQRDLVLQFIGYCRDRVDQKLVLQALSNFFIRRHNYWITFDNGGGRMYHVREKSIAAEYHGEKMMTITVTLNNFTGVAQSIVPSINISDMPNIGLGLPTDTVNYVFNTSEFDVNNIGELPVDPLVQGDYLDITLTCTGSPTIANTTTGDEITCTKSLASGDTFNLIGVNPQINGQAAGINTDNGIIRLASGNNHFKITGCQDLNCTVSFYFKYLN
ncbi:phage tail protein [Lactiplantibacillus plantarum]|uniref:phage tail domain-containing protein n=1 Tax=Lactiplantibacillus plantarum TaxID=1590 RepID=UPI0007885250|nr:phage tail domain-containing protein [Lactiplantibacillus plantarum]KYK53715.1 phage tail protein [Lactiplantibacillus plantarum]KYM71006.1 phage tail protein [Lactiplantibacillus plantarum]